MPDPIELFNNVSRRVDALRSDLDTNITSIKNGTLFAGTSFSSVLSSVNFFENCTTSIKTNCTIQPPMPGTVFPTPCITPEVMTNIVSFICSLDLIT